MLVTFAELERSSFYFLECLLLLEGDRLWANEAFAVPLDGLSVFTFLDLSPTVPASFEGFPHGGQIIQTD